MSFQPHMRILPPSQMLLWPKLKPTIDLGMVLYGGTAIALRLGHRHSVDFDFFSEKPLDKAVLQQAFPFMKNAATLQDQPNALTVLVPGGDPGDDHVKVSFFGTIDFGRVGDPEITQDGVLQVAGLDDLMATKVKVILQRVEAKDYRDIAAMIKAGVSLPRALAAARQMYGPSFQPSESLKAMVYFEGGDLHTLTQDEKEVLIETTSAVRELPQVELISRKLSVNSPEPSDDSRFSF